MTDVLGDPDPRQSHASRYEPVDMRKPYSDHLTRGSCFGIRSLSVAAESLQKQPPASKHQLAGVLKLSGQVECDFQPVFRECLE